MSCGTGFIIRKGYTTKKGVHVSPSCITDVGQPGKGVALFKLKTPMHFEKFNYHILLPLDERQSILQVALKEVEPISLLKYLVALRTVNKSNPTKYANLDSDVSFVQSLYKYKTPRRASPRRTSGRRR
jgi:hypothetical protein